MQRYDGEREREREKEGGIRREKICCINRCEIGRQIKRTGFEGEKKMREKRATMEEEK